MAHIISMVILLVVVAIGYISPMPATATGNVSGRNNGGSHNGKDNKAGYNGNDNRGSGNGNNNFNGINGNGNGGDDPVDWKQYLAGLNINSQKGSNAVVETSITESDTPESSTEEVTSGQQEETTANTATPKRVNYKLYTPRSYYKPHGYQYGNRNYYNSNSSHSWSKYLPQLYY